MTLTSLLASDVDERAKNATFQLPEGSERRTAKGANWARETRPMNTLHGTAESRPEDMIQWMTLLQGYSFTGHH
jgi:hypothetical protein